MLVVLLVAVVVVALGRSARRVLTLVQARRRVRVAGAGVAAGHHLRPHVGAADWRQECRHVAAAGCLPVTGTPEEHDAQDDKVLAVAAQLWLAANVQRQLSKEHVDRRLRIAAGPGVQVDVGQQVAIDEAV